MKDYKSSQVHPVVRSVILADTFSEVVAIETKKGTALEESLAVAAAKIITAAQKKGWSCQYELLEYLITDRHGAKPKAFLTAARTFMGQSDNFAHFIDWFKANVVNGG